MTADWREGDHVRVGFTDCRIVRLEAKGAVVQPLRPEPGGATLPYWVPFSHLTAIPRDGGR